MFNKLKSVLIPYFQFEYLFCKKNLFILISSQTKCAMHLLLWALLKFKPISVYKMLSTGMYENIQGSLAKFRQNKRN